MEPFDKLYGNLTTIGRKTQKPHTVELTFYYEDGKVYLLAHKRDNGKMTDWYYNLQKTPDCGFEVGEKKFKARTISLGEDSELEEKIKNGFIKKGGQEFYNTWYKGTNRVPVVVELL